MSSSFEVINGVKLHKYHNDQILSYTLTSATENTLSDLSHYVIDSLQALPKDKPYLVVHDISQAGIGLLFATAVQNEIFNIGILPSAQEKIQSLIDANPDWQIRLALIVSASLSGRLARVLFQSNDPADQMQFKAFFSKEPALSWLIESVSKED